MKTFYTQIDMKVQPSEDNHVVTKKYLELAIAKKVKDSVVAVIASNIDATYNSTTKQLTQTTGAKLNADDVDLAVGDRVLVTGQTDATQNGIYVVDTVGTDETSEGAGDGTPAVLTRATDLDGTEDFALNFIVNVQKGSTQADSTWVLANDTIPTLDTDPIIFTSYKDPNAATTFTAEIAGDGVEKYIDVTHGLGTEDVIIRVVDKTTKEECIFNAVATSENVIRLNADVVLKVTDEFVITIIG